MNKKCIDRISEDRSYPCSQSNAFQMTFYREGSSEGKVEVR